MVVLFLFCHYPAQYVRRRACKMECFDFLLLHKSGYGDLFNAIFQSCVLNYRSQFQHMAVTCMPKPTEHKKVRL